MADDVSHFSFLLNHSSSVCQNMSAHVSFPSRASSSPPIYHKKESPLFPGQFSPFHPSFGSNNNKDIYEGLSACAPL